ncbi:lysine-rich arabinogalactan protein 18-like [Humulus lupulus]|uniref:lysine-rich arabinogalactan protein 18-like n=1 Tax=Humulus lupulus TaxID=3486 RepID=UPI002B410FDA|nr:lysine-rich arabinogalactan protein 18-like [Humulus lupulus]
MPAERAFHLYTNPTSSPPTSTKKLNRCQPGEGCSDPSAKMAQTEGHPTPTPSKETTPPPVPVDHNPPPAPADTTPPTSTDQVPPGQPEKVPGEALMNMALSLAKDRLTKLSRHRRTERPSTTLNLWKSTRSLTRVLTMSTGWRRSGALTAQYEKRLGE